MAEKDKEKEKERKPKLIVIQIINDPNPITNKKVTVICKTEEGKTIVGIGNTEQEAIGDAEKKAD